MFKFEALDIWKLSIEFANAVYKVTEKFPEEERFGLTSQVRRSVSHFYLSVKRDYISKHEYQALRQQAEILVKKIKSFKSWLDKNEK